MRSLAIISRKGGAGKSTLALNLAVGAHLRGRRALLHHREDPRSLAPQTARRRFLIPRQRKEKYAFFHHRHGWLIKIAAAASRKGFVIFLAFFGRERAAVTYEHLGVRILENFNHADAPSTLLPSFPLSPPTPHPLLFPILHVHAEDVECGGVTNFATLAGRHMTQQAIRRTAAAKTQLNDRAL